MLTTDRRSPLLGRDDQASDTVVDVLTEEQLLRGMESMTPTEPSAAVSGNGGGRGGR
jgi:DNA-directed RNA polymerase subunit omega